MTRPDTAPAATPVSAPDLGTAVAAAARRLGLLTPNERVLVAVSGGADSTALAVILAEAAGSGLPLDLVLGHVDHGWRTPAQRAADAACVQALAARLGVPARVSPPPPAGTPATEDAARRYRYGWLGRTAAAEGCRAVAVGHHLGDQAETFLMRLLRGAGPVGLAGIPVRRPLGESGVEVVRPLLEVDPAALRHLLGARDVAWREDPTNRDVARDRARIRNRIGRLLETVPDAHARLAAHARRLRARVERTEAMVVARVEAALQPWPWADAVALSRAWLAGLAAPLHLALALRAAGRRLHADRDGPWLTRRHVARIRTLLEQGGAIDLPRGLAFRAVGGRAWLRRRVPDARPLPALCVARLPREAAHGLGDGRSGACVDAGRLGPAPRVRRLAAGDRFTPFGRAAGQPVVVARWLSRRGIPAFARRGTLVVEGAGGVAWVVGQRIDQGHAVTGDTTTVARLALEPPPA